MKVSLLTQIAPENRLLTRIGPEAKTAESAFIAVSFIQKAGMKHLFQRLRTMLEKDRPISIYTAGYLGITDPSALADLLRLTEHYESLKAYFNLEERFHSKFLLFEKPNGAYSLFLGSSNISVGGLAATGELNIQVRGQRTDRVYKDMQIVIDALRKNRDFEELTDDLIDQYRRQHAKRAARKPPPGRRPRLVLPLEKMLVYLVTQGFTEREERKIEEKHPRWETYVSYGQQFKRLNTGDHFLCISKYRGRTPTFTVCKYLEHDRIDGVGTIVHTKDGDSYSLSRLAKSLKLSEKTLLGMKSLDVYGIAILRRDFEDAFG